MARPLFQFRDVAELRWHLDQAIRKLAPSRLLSAPKRKRVLTLLTSALAATGSGKSGR